MINLSITNERPPPHPSPRTCTCYIKRSMRHLLRIMLNAATVLSLLLFLASVVLWVRSHWVGDWLIWKRGRVFWLASVAGQFRVGGGYSSNGDQFNYQRIPPDTDFSEMWPLSSEVIEFAGFAVDKKGSPTWYKAAAPAWAVVVPSAVLPGIWLVKRRRRDLARPGLWPGCGYDLRATPDRCPECGRANPSTATPR